MSLYGIEKYKVYHEYFDETKIHNILKDKIQFWKPDTPVFISAQTGAGKSHFILNELIPYQSNKSVLYKVESLVLFPHANTPKYIYLNPEAILILSNRLANSTQFKKDLCEKLDIHDDSLENTYRFKNIYIYTYQKFIKSIKELPITKIRYVILDEAHFFIEDASFNSDTYHILDTVLKNFIFAVRIYMTATLDNVAKHICEAESSYFSKIKDLNDLLKNKFTSSFIEYINNIYNPIIYYGINEFAINETKKDYIWNKFCSDSNFQNATLEYIKAILDCNSNFNIPYSEPYLPSKFNIEFDSEYFYNYLTTVFAQDITSTEDIHLFFVCMVQYFLFYSQHYIQYFQTYSSVLLEAEKYSHWLLTSVVSEQTNWLRPTNTGRIHSRDGKNPSLKSVTLYDFYHDYTNYSIVPYSNYNHLFEQILSNKTEKWLIFVDKSSIGKDLQEKLKSKNIKSIFLNSEIIHSDKNYINEKQAFESLIQNRRFDVNVLITTSILDSGFTIFDTDLKHIVVPVCNKTSFIQMIGRKRFLPEESNCKLSLYIPNCQLKEINDRIRQLHSTLLLIKKYKFNPQKAIVDCWNNNSMHAQAKNIIRCIPNYHSPSTNNSNNYFELNDFAEIKIKQDIDFYKLIKDEINEKGNSAYISIVSKWLRNEFDENIPIKTSCAENIRLLISNWHLLDKSNPNHLDLEQLNNFFNEFSKLYDQQLYGNFHSDKKNNRTLQNINNAFKAMNMPYKFKKSKNLYIY